VTTHKLSLFSFNCLTLTFLKGVVFCFVRNISLVSVTGLYLINPKCSVPSQCMPNESVAIVVILSDEDSFKG